MNETTDATAIFAPIWRRKWLILIVGLVVGAATYLYYKGQTPVYQASTQVYLGGSAEEQAPGEKTSSKGRTTSVSGQPAVINSIVVEKVHALLRRDNEAKLARGSSVRAKVPEKSEFITISTEAHSARGAALLANLTAQLYVRRHNNIYRHGIETAIAISRRQLRRIEAASAASAVPPASTSKGKRSGSSPAGTGSSSSGSIIQAANLSSRINQLESSLGAVGAQQVKPARADTATLFSPKPRKDAIFGFVIGVVLAAIAAYAFSRFDRRLRSLAAIEDVLKAPILSALPRVGRPIIGGEGGVRPSAFLLEPLRRLHTALQLQDGPMAGSASESEANDGGRVVLFVSADPGDGKSTLIAGLALVQRDAGARVAIVEANFRRPVQARLLGLDGRYGLGDVLAGGLSVQEAMQRVPPPHLPAGLPAAAHPGEDAGAVSTAVQTRAGSLFVLTGGGSVANPPALLANESMADLLATLAGEFDYVLVDAPSPLEVSDAMPLLGVAGGIVTVARAGHTREAAAQRLRQLLDRTSIAPVIGTAANFVGEADLRRYGFSTPNGRVWPGKLMGR